MEINAAEFRANCFKILDQVKLTHGEVIITKRGEPIAKLVHISQPKEKDPADQIIAATARTNNLTLLTKDRKMGSGLDL